MTDGFLSRWSKRKLDVQEGKPVLAEPPASALRAPESQAHPANVTAKSLSPDLRVGGASDLPALPPAEATVEAVPDVPLPTLADAQALTPQSDFKPFMARGVAADVKNAAMKKLFTDPHYNVMDRLDTYIDDYSLPDPIPEAMLRQMVSAKFLNLFSDEENPEKDNPVALRDDANTPTDEVVAQSPITLQPPIAHDHPDMRLQPDHAPAGKSPGRGAA
jgi:hypothetical protein